MIRLSFLGGSREVGRSAALVDTGTEKILLDYGIKINVKPTQHPNKVNTKLNAILLSHSHLDHSGAIPVLFHQGQKCPVYCMGINRPFSRMLLLDSYKISRYEGEKERYSKADIKKTMRKFKTIKYRKPFNIGKTKITAFDAGHIPGSAIFLLENQNKRILYTGDFNTSDTRLIRGVDLDIPQVDVLITESTYGCVTGNSKVSLSNGNTQKIKDLHDGVTVKAMTKGLMLKNFKVSKTWKRLHKGMMFTITTESNRKLTMTPNHPLFVKEGRKLSIKLVSQLKIGDKVPILPPLKNLNVLGSGLLHIHELKHDDRVYVKLKHTFIDRIKSKISKKRYEIANILGIPEGTLKDYLRINSYQNSRTGKRKLYFMPLKISKKLCQLANLTLDTLENNVIWWKSKNSSKILKNIFPIKKDAKLAKLLSKSFGDGHVRFEDLYFEYRNTSNELLSEVDKLAKELGFKISYYENRHYYPLLGCILNTLGCPRVKVNEVMRVPVWVKNGSLEIKKAFLQGLFDDEGHVSYYKTKGNRILRRIMLKMAKNKRLKNNLIEFFAELKQMLVDLDIESRIDFGGEYGDKIQLVLIIQGIRNINNFQKTIGFTHSSKKKILSRIIDEKWQKRTSKINVVYEKILNIEKFYVDEIEVFDLTIGKLGEWGNFIANGIVIHNSREHPNREKEERKMIDVINGTLANDGIALVPCFAIARSQEVMLILDEYELKEKIYLDGMAKKATRIINEHPGTQREYNQVKKAMQRLRVKPVTNRSIRKKAIKKPSIIITTSGMLSGGPIVNYIERLWNREECSLILTGFQVPGTEGSILLQTGQYIHSDMELPVKMNVRKFDFSSHTPRSGLFKFVKKVNPEKVFCLHGDDTKKFAQELREEYGFDAIAPKLGDSFSVK